MTASMNRLADDTFVAQSGADGTSTHGGGHLDPAARAPLMAVTGR